MKRLAPKYFDRVAEFCYTSWFAVLPPNIDYEDLFDPVVWSNFRGKIQTTRPLFGFVPTTAPSMCSSSLSTSRLEALI